MTRKNFLTYVNIEGGGEEMAWLDGRWVEREERAEIISVYAEYLEVMDASYPTIEDLEEAGYLEEYYGKSIELERLERIHRCEVDSYEFALEYFSEGRNPENQGNWDGFDIDTKENAPEFHTEMTSIIDHISWEDKNGKVAIAAPRSHAKSTWYTKDFPIHQVVYRLRNYIIIISETPTVASANMEWIRNQLKHNDKLRGDFGELLSPKDQANEKDNSEEFIAWYRDGDRRHHVALVQAASTGQAIRGRNWNGFRPDLIICDDLEDARSGGNASTPEQREKLRDWFSQTVMALGDPGHERTAFVVVGTTVHFDSLLMNLLYKRSDFRSRVYRAIIDHPVNEDLWEELRKIYIDIDNEDRLADADAFFEENKEALLEGSSVLWEDMQPLYHLMRWRWDNGSKAFNTEYQNNPIDEESQIFVPERFTYFDPMTIKFPHSKYYISMGLDFAMGKQRGDYSALITVARHKATGRIFVIDTFIERVHPDVFLKQIVERVKKFQPDIIGAEAQMAQEFFVDTLKRELEFIGYPAHTRVKKIQQRQRKELRIEAMLPDIENGIITFAAGRDPVLLEHFERYGSSWHDDGPDALSMAVTSSKRPRAVIQQKPGLF